MNPHVERDVDGVQLSSVCANHIPDRGSAQGALSRPAPLLDSTLEAHAHVPAGVEDAVHVRLVADHALGGDERRVQGGRGAG